MLNQKKEAVEAKKAALTKVKDARANLVLAKEELATAREAEKKFVAVNKVTRSEAQKAATAKMVEANKKKKAAK